MLPTQDVLTGVFLTNSAAHVSEDAYYERTKRAVPRLGDLLYSREGTYYGIAAEVPARVRVCLGQRLVLIRPDKAALDFRFLRYWLNSPVMGAYINGFRDGSVAERLNLPTIRSLPILIPPIEEQRVIAGALGAFDDKIAVNDRIAETGEELALTIASDERWAQTPDGTAWRATALTGPTVDSQAAAAATWRTGTVVVGSVGAAADRRAAVWISPTPGAPFAQASGAALLIPNSAMTAVTSGTLGLFAAGTAGGRVAMWYSSDGHHWTSLTGADRVIGAAEDPHVDTLLATANEGVYAAGWVRNGSSTAAAVWSSGDGINWHAVLSAPAAFSGPGDHLITAMAALRNGPSPVDIGLVAVGGTWTGSHWVPASWISPNGASWSPPSTAFSLGARPQPGATDAIVRGLAAVPSPPLSTRLVAVGGGPTAQRLWESTDGLHWTELPLPPAGAVSDQWRASLVAVAGPTSVVADGDPGQPRLLVDRGKTGWQQPSADASVFGPVQTIATPAGLAVTPGLVTLAVKIDDPGQALGPGASSTRLLASADGTSWNPIPTGAVFAGATVTGLTAGPEGLVAVGWHRVGSLVKAVAWTSPDGRTWRVMTPLDARPTPGSDEAGGVCASGGEIVAVGSALSTGGHEVARAGDRATGCTGCRYASRRPPSPGPSRP